MSSSSTLRLSNYSSFQVPNSSTFSSRSTSNLLSSAFSSASPTPSPSSNPSSRRSHPSQTLSRLPPSLNSSRERKAHAKKLLKKYPVISPQSFGRVSKFCPVCLDFLTNGTITKTVCNHFVHRSCLLKRLSDDPAAMCPSCCLPVKPPRASKNGRSGGGILDKAGQTPSLQLGGRAIGGLDVTLQWKNKGRLWWWWVCSYCCDGAYKGGKDVKIWFCKTFISLRRTVAKMLWSLSRWNPSNVHGHCQNSFFRNRWQQYSGSIRHFRFINKLFTRFRNDYYLAWFLTYSKRAPRHIIGYMTHSLAVASRAVQQRQMLTHIFS